MGPKQCAYKETKVKNCDFFDGFVTLMSEETFLTKLHKQIRQEKQLQSLLDAEIKKQRESIDAHIKKLLIEYRKFLLLDTWYPRLNIVTNDISEIIQSALYSGNKRKIYDTPTSVPFPAAISLKVGHFLKGYMPYINLICKCIDKYFTVKGTPIPNQIYVPASPLQFFASSTFPALFGYGWCIEQGVAYVNSLIYLFKLQMDKYNTVNSSEFRNSYTRDFLKHFFHLSGVQTYLQDAISMQFMLFIKDNKLETVDTNSSDYSDLLMSYVSKFACGLLTALPSMPIIVRYFFSCVYQIAFNKFESEASSRTLVINLFFDAIVCPAIINPKLYSIIPETSQFNLTTNATILANFMKFPFSPRLAQKYTYLERTAEFKGAKEKLDEIISSLCSYEGSIDGIYSTQLQEITDQRYHVMLISLNDIKLLTYIINQTISELENEVEKDEIERLKSMCQFSDSLNIESDGLVDFWYQSFKFYELPAKFSIPPVEKTPDIALPIKMSTVPATPKDDVETIVKHLINYMQLINVNENKQKDLLGFLNAQYEKAKADSSNEWIARTQALMSKIQNMIKSGVQLDVLLARVSISIRKKIDSHFTRLSSSFTHQDSSILLQNKLLKAQSMNTQIEPIFYQHILKIMLSEKKLFSHIKIVDEFQSQKSKLMKKPKEWSSFFTKSYQIISSEVESLNLDSLHTNRLCRQMHSYLLSDNSFLYYTEIHKKKSAISSDTKLLQRYPNLISTFIPKTNNSELNTLISNNLEQQELFGDVLMIIKQGLIYGTPLENIAKMSESIPILQNIYYNEIGKRCEDNNELLVLFHFALLHAQFPFLVSMRKYIRHFIVSISSTKILDKEEEKTVKLFMTATKQIMLDAKKLS